MSDVTASASASASRRGRPARMQGSVAVKP